MSYIKMLESGIVFTVVCMAIRVSIAGLVIIVTVDALGGVEIRARPLLVQKLGRHNPTRRPWPSQGTNAQAAGRVCGQCLRPPRSEPAQERRSSYLSDSCEEHVKHCSGIS